jgi:hypothetical protein
MGILTGYQDAHAFVSHLAYGLHEPLNQVRAVDVLVCFIEDDELVEVLAVVRTRQISSTVAGLKGPGGIVIVVRSRWMLRRRPRSPAPAN